MYGPTADSCGAERFRPQGARSQDENNDEQQQKQAKAEMVLHGRYKAKEARIPAELGSSTRNAETEH